MLPLCIELYIFNHTTCITVIYIYTYHRCTVWIYIGQRQCMQEPKQHYSGVFGTDQRGNSVVVLKHNVLIKTYTLSVVKIIADERPLHLLIGWQQN